MSTAEDASANVFSLGVAHARTRPRLRIRRVRAARANTDDIDWTPPSFSIDWTPQTPPEPGMIRMLHPVDTAVHACYRDWWGRDRTLTSWMEDIDALERDLSANTIAAAFAPPDYARTVRAHFLANQRRRWLAYWVIQRLRYRIWRRRAQCAVDLIEMNPVVERDAIYLMDTHVRCVYCFHRNDVARNLLSNLSMADEMFPTPRTPTNPWTNAVLTLAQTISVCQQLMAMWGHSGRAPTVLFAAFCAAGYNVERLRTQYSSLLAEEAIRTFFRDLTEETMPVVYDTMMQLFAEMGLTTSPIAVRRWLRTTPATPQHQAWLHFARDYTLYINLHVQVRPDWVDMDTIKQDAARLLATSCIPDATSTRMQNLRQRAVEIRSGPPMPAGIPFLIPMLDVSGAVTNNDIMEMDVALQLIQNALLRM